MLSVDTGLKTLLFEDDIFQTVNDQVINFFCSIRLLVAIFCFCACVLLSCV